jgi:hypothetical protein
MRTKFSKRLVASGLIAALGANIVVTGPAFAGPDRDRNYSRGDQRHDDGRRDQGRSRQDGRRDVRHDGNRGNGDNRRPAVKIVEQPAVVHRQGDNRRPAVKVVEKPVAVHRQVEHRRPAVKIVERPVVVHRDVHRNVVVNRSVRADYHPGHGHYGPPPTRVIVVPERRRYRDVWVVRHYGHRYHGFGHYHHDHDAYRWLAFTAISVSLINALTEVQQRSYEDAQIRAAAAPIGQTIVWNNGNAAGTVTAVRDGTSSQNRYCREFQQTVTIGGNSEQAYGTACMQPDGAWEVVQQPAF